MEVLFFRDPDAAYAVLSGEAGSAAFFRRMLEQNRIPALLPLRRRPGGAPEEYAYEISGCRSLESMLSSREIRIGEITELLKTLYRLIGELSEYLFDADQLVLEPGLIFRGQGGWLFLVYPPGKEDIFRQLQGLARFFLKKADHGDPETAEAVYRLFTAVHEENCTFPQVFEAIACPLPEREEEEPEPVKPLSSGPDKGETISFGSFLRRLLGK